MQQPTRRLAAILFTDIVGSTSMMQKDEQHAVSINRRYVAVLKECVLPRGGEILNDFGDGSLCTFHSATEALRCAIDMQQKFQLEPKVPLRIGLHVGEIFFEDGKVFGDGVNVASRVQSLGIANSILFSSQINSQIKNQQEFKSVSVGRFHFKNVDEPMEVFALANEGLTVPKKEELTGKLKEIEKKSILRKWITAVVAILLLIGSFFIYQTFFHSSGFSGEKTIAVLPFENSGEPDSEEYVSDGITQDIINNLSKISELQKVIAWFSVRGFKKTTKPIKQIAEELGVAAILTGTVERQADKTIIKAALIEVNTNKQIWGDEFEYNSKELLSVQSKVAGQIVAALKINLTSEEKRNLAKKPTDNQEAYNLCLKGRFYWNKGSPAALDSAEYYYKQATQLDPSYALAYSGLADCYRINHRLTMVETIPIAKDYALKALSLDSTLCEAWTTLGWIQSIFERNWNSAKIILEKAIRLNPNYPLAQLYYGNILLFNGSTEEGIKKIEKAANLDPLSILIGLPLGRNYYESRHYDLAIRQLRKVLILDSTFDAAKPWLGLSYVQKKLYKEANDIFEQIRNPRDKSCLLSYSYSIAGDKEKGLRELTKALQIEKGSTLFFANVQFHFFAAQAFIGLGKTNEALTELENSFEAHEVHLDNLKIDPALDPIRNEPRYKALLKKMNLD